MVECDKMELKKRWSTEAESVSIEETSSLATRENVDPEKIEYTPEEVMYNDLVMQIEGEALDRVNQEAINAYSTALK